jgi:hypothetical protein
MLLDAFDVVFVWVGSKSTQNEKEMGMNTALVSDSRVLVG